MKKEECRKLVIVEWCEEDKCFHYDDLANSLIKNIQAYFEERPIRYAPVAIVNSYDAAIAFTRELEASRPAALRQWAERIPGFRESL